MKTGLEAPNSNSWNTSKVPRKWFNSLSQWVEEGQYIPAKYFIIALLWSFLRQDFTWIKDTWRALVCGCRKKMYRDRLGEMIGVVSIVDYHGHQLCNITIWAVPGIVRRLLYSCIHNKPFGFCELVRTFRVWFMWVLYIHSIFRWENLLVWYEIKNQSRDFATKPSKEDTFRDASTAVSSVVLGILSERKAAS